MVGEGKGKAVVRQLAQAFALTLGAGIRILFVGRTPFLFRPTCSFLPQILTTSSLPAKTLGPGKCLNLAKFRAILLFS